ncbi:MAG: hypothetical protein AB7J28_17205 [Hyphomonadaceae bacterium]
MGVASPLAQSLILGGGTGAIAAPLNVDTPSDMPLAEALQERGEHVLGGAGAGATVSAVLHGLTRGLVPRTPGGGVPIVNAIGQFFQRQRQAGRQQEVELTPEQAERGRQTGMQFIRNLVQRIDPDGTRLRTNRMEAEGLPVTAAEALGREAQTQLKAAGRRSGQTPDRLEAQLSARASENAAGVVDDFARETRIDPAAAEGNLARVAEALRAAARPQYQAYEATGSFSNDALQGVLRTPAGQRAVRMAMEMAGNEQVPFGAVEFRVQGRPVTFNGHTLRHRDGRPVMEDETIEIVHPSARSWDYIQRAFSRMVTGSERTASGLFSPEAQAVMNLRNQLVDQVDAITQGRYRAALDAGGDPIRLEQAFRAADRLLNNNIPFSRFQTLTQNYTAPQRAALQAGWINAIRTRMEAGRLRLNDMLTPAFENKMINLFGVGPARRMTQLLRDRQTLMRQGARMAPQIGSDTSETLLSAGEQAAGVRRAAERVRSFLGGRPVTAFINLIGDRIAGLQRGIQQPFDRAARDMIGELLMMAPSELADTLKRAGATQAQVTQAQTMLQRLFNAPEDAERLGLREFTAAYMTGDPLRREAERDRARAPAPQTAETRPTVVSDPLANIIGTATVNQPGTITFRVGDRFITVRAADGVDPATAIREWRAGRNPAVSVGSADSAASVTVDENGNPIVQPRDPALDAAFAAGQRANEGQ